ncbi:uncharacterized protein PITG_09235 [Phytophthora infestans T30-4]|uniref:Uncharacterized protein n=1 Tax=Phytophthora infestans (strain T30-4) TaxID=403677 RepID=D0NB72_PHYIT|nr:uncharacterized protein PITG_09235 [Phytophthora infestans T30-4]EEY55301.1 hypothetical protein PITG_09235 [Phytophthora infestans T30-4]|eukprot:XP_002903525.1 hypothetical protein PITG_09235 [Phytophthora infestans T30-4]
MLRGKQVRDADVTFEWRELRDQGWTNKRLSSRGLDDRHRYVRPGCNLTESTFSWEKAVLCAAYSSASIQPAYPC